MSKIARGGTAEWCAKCRLEVLPICRIARKGLRPETWHCPYCSTKTAPHD